MLMHPSRWSQLSPEFIERTHWVSVEIGEVGRTSQERSTQQGSHVSWTNTRNKHRDDLYLGTCSAKTLCEHEARQSRVRSNLQIPHQQERNQQWSKAYLCCMSSLSNFLSNWSNLNFIVWKKTCVVWSHFVLKRFELIEVRYGGSPLFVQEAQHWVCFFMTGCPDNIRSSDHSPIFAVFETTANEYVHDGDEDKLDSFRLRVDSIEAILSTPPTAQSARQVQMTSEFFQTNTPICQVSDVFAITLHLTRLTVK